MAAVGSEEFAVQDEVITAFPDGFPRFPHVRALGGQHVDVAVAGGAADACYPRPDSQPRWLAVVAQNGHGLLAAAQSAGIRSNAAAAALIGRQTRSPQNRLS
ncbi:hypothetical protein HDA32_003279 [Spinactinospora alkalitolerans]|uniref:Uncharacterized protein n=1 Tax=Spinactinospora alkalitolerans TaxID=687207 RepID=A0A852TVX8_9ACTN|nr:hypothetical protein [Spinactinospora alkalitolerans]NYE48159.1 hypothetical protein [Spinactinospora alkalitolerans]